MFLEPRSSPDKLPFSIFGYPASQFSTFGLDLGSTKGKRWLLSRSRIVRRTSRKPAFKESVLHDIDVCENRSVPIGSTLDHNEIRRIAITAVFSDDYFFEKVVLKGGNALAIALELSRRTSLDLDFSIENDFDDVSEAERRLKAALERRFATVGLVVVDFAFSPRPLTPREGESRWGGYVAEFKLLDDARYKEIGDNREARGRASRVIGPRQQRRFTIELSKFEYTKGKLARELDGFDIYVYAPEMIAIEKLRAICQQMPSYSQNRTPSARARDFFDIHLIVSKTGTDLASRENEDLLRNIFAAKDVSMVFCN